MKIGTVELPTPETPAAKFLSWAITIVIGTMAVWLFLDGYFAHAADVVKRDTAVAIQIQYAADLNEKRRIEDNLFRIEQIPPAKRTDGERAQVAKYERDLATLMRTWEVKGMTLK